MRPEAVASFPLAIPASPRERAAHDRQVIAGAQSGLVTVKILDDLHQGGGLPGYIAGDVVAMAAAAADRFVAAGVASHDLDAGPRPKVRPAEISNGAPTAAAGGPVRMELVHPWGTMMAGEAAGFNADLAHELEVRGIARPWRAPPLRVRSLRAIRDALTGRR